MPDIQLRDYTARIKTLIRDIRLDEAIAHCQQILRHYPKHIETYCLLGEACLEKELYREAIEFFQRTLSADPENLIARVGLGIIYDEQGALPEAIWQLERAYELAPGNAEVRRELQRLYAQHNGVERFRLKLTRGALGRLYSRNGMYERAVDEFQAVLRQDPDLPDIRVALVEALWREGRRLETVEACLEVIEALPYCLKANLILGEVWLRGGNEEAGEEKLQVARALDPENLMAQELMGSDSPLPAEAVFLPELEALPEELESVVPARPVVPLPGVLAEEEAWEEALPLEGEEPLLEEEEFPDWLRDLEMEVKEEPAVEMAAEEMDLVEVQPGEEIPADELPAWLQEVMGEEPLSSAEETVALDEVAEAEEVWPGEEVPERLHEAEEMEEVTAPLAMEVPVEEVPPEEVPAEPVPTEEILPGGEVPAGILLTAAALLRDDKAPEAEPVAEDLEVEEAEAVPDWVQAIAAEAPEAFEAAVQPPEMVEAEEMALPVMGEGVEEKFAPRAAVPASLLALVEAGLLDESDLDAAMGEMSVEELEVQRAEQVPSWLEELITEEAVPAAEEAVPPIEEQLPFEEPLLIEEEAPPAEELPDWLLAFEAGEEAVPEEEAPEPVVEAVEEEVLLVEEEVPEPVAEVVEEEVLLVEEEVPEPVVEVVEEEVLLVEEEVPEPVAEVVAEEVLLVEEEVPEPVAEVVEEEVLLVEEEVPELVTEVVEEEVLLVEEEVPEPVTEVVEEEVLLVEEEVPELVVEVVEEEVPLVEEVVPPSRVDRLREQLAAQPRSYGARLELARAYGDEQDWDAALVQYEKLVSARKLLPEVLKDLQPMVDKEVNRARLYQLMGDIYMQQNDLDDALEMYRQARRSLTR